MSYCNLYPTVENKNGDKVDSILFKDLMSATKNKELAKLIWGLTRVPGFFSNESIERDVNGEPTIKEALKVAKELGLNDLSKNSELIQKGLLTADGSPVVSKDYRNLYSTAINHNESNPEDLVTVVKTPEGYTTKVLPNNVINRKEVAKLPFKRALHNKLLSIMRDLGFDVGFADNPDFDGVFSVDKAETNANGLKEVIKIAKGERGERAFLEEFSHLMIRGLIKTPLVQRLLKTLDSREAVEAVLGEEFAAYDKEYKGDLDRLKEEAAGKLLADYFREGKGTLESRIWGLAKSKFAKGSVDSVDVAIAEATEILDGIRNTILSDQLKRDFNASELPSAQTLYALSEKTSRLEQWAKKALELTEKKYSTVLSRTGDPDSVGKTSLAILDMRRAIRRKKFVVAVSAFLREAVNDLSQIREALLQYNNEAFSTDMKQLKALSYTLRHLNAFSKSHGDIIKELANLRDIALIEDLELSDIEIDQIQQLAISISNTIATNEEMYKKLRYQAIYSFFSKMFGEQRTITMGKNKGEVVTLDAILTTASHDINTVESWILSLGDASDELLSMIHRVFIERKDARKAELRQVIAKVETATKKLMKAGGKTSAIYETDENGLPTGWLLSDWDMGAYERARQEELESLKEEYGDDVDSIKYWIHMWEQNHTYQHQFPDGTERDMPIRTNPAWYKKDRVKSMLSPAEYEYYQTMIELKMELDTLLPGKFTHPFKAPQIKNDVIQSIDWTNPKATAETMWDTLKDNFTKTVDDTEYGGSNTGEVFDDMSSVGIKSVALDMLGKPVETIPIHYVNMIDNPRRLSTDFSSAILSYADMALNYAEMNKVIDILELARDFISDREVTQTVSSVPLVDSFKAVGERVSRLWKKEGNTSAIKKRLDDYYEANFYGKAKKENGNVKIGDTVVNSGKVLDTLRQYHSMLSLGLNIFSAGSNVLVGKHQITVEAIASSFVGNGPFKILDVIKADLKYFKMLPKLLFQLNGVRKDSMLQLLIDEFDAVENLTERIAFNKYYDNWFQRIIGNVNTHFLNSMGEHYLHSVGMLAVLNSIKVKVNGKATTLDNAYERVTLEDGSVVLRLKDGVTDMDGNAVTPEFIQNIKNTIRKTNQDMHGAYNQEDKGAIHRYAMGRAAGQYRQWMPAFYNKRFGKTRYNAELNKDLEGYYVTTFRILKGLLKDYKHIVGAMRLLGDQLTKDEKSNLAKAAGEISIFILLTILSSVCGDDDKTEGNWAARYAQYQLKRVTLEIGAGIPWFTSLSNIQQIAKSPIPAVDIFEDIGAAFNFFNAFDEVQSGPYKGWTEWERDVFKALPFFEQGKRAYDLAEKEYMFNTFK